MENLEFYNKYREVPQNAQKEFDNGKFKGTDINTMWRIKCLTETFGICGVGWYYDIVRTWCETGENSKETIAHAEIKLYIKVDGEWSKGISGIGGNKLETYSKKYGYWNISDECYKMATTDALGNACRNLGMGADIYWQNDRTKYTAKNEKEDFELDQRLVEKLESLGGTIEICATYYNKMVNELTNKDLKELIAKKEQVIAEKNLVKASGEIDV